MVFTSARKIIVPAVLALFLSSCAGKGLSDFFPSFAGAGAAALCSTAGPAAAAACSGAAGIGVEVAIPAKQPTISDNPEIAKQQIKAQERTNFIDMVLKYAFWLLVLLWFVPTPKAMLTGLIRKIKEI